MKQLFHIPVLILLLVFAVNSRAQTFTKITSTSNPVVTDTARSGGGSWIDIDNDNDLDLLVSNGNLTAQENHLYINNGNGNFVRVTTGNMATDGGSSIGSAWGDYNNDGFTDCFVTNRNNFGNFLYEGNGTFNPVVQTGIAPVTDISNSNSSSWIDVDNDGDLDLYVVNFMADDFFYINQGGPGYTFSANQTNAIQNDNAGFSIPAMWADFNNDRKPDLFVGNAGSQNDKLYINNGGLSFTPVTIADASSTLGGSWGDYDNDGDLDLYITNYSNQTSILYNNSGAPLYTLTPLGNSPVHVTGNGVGSGWGDVDNDGDLDLFACADGDTNSLFLNSGFPAYTFTAVTTGQIVNDMGNSFGCSMGDYDNDGSLDIFVANQLGQANFLYHNDGNSNNWITIICKGVISNKSAIGAKVFMKANINNNMIWQMQEVLPQSGYNSQNLWLHFGLAAATVADSIIIRWPSGLTDTCTNINANSIYVAQEGTCLAVVGIEPQEQQEKWGATIFPNPAQNSTSLSFTLEKEETVDIKITAINGAILSALPAQKEMPGKHVFSLQTDILKPGFYFCKITCGNRYTIIPFAVIR